MFFKFIPKVSSKPGNAYRRGRLRTVDLLIEIGLVIKKNIVAV
jgi:hypothetical protein